MKKKHDPKSVILTIILIITYALSVVFNFSHMMDGKGSRKPGAQLRKGSRLSSGGVVCQRVSPEDRSACRIRGES